MKHQRIASLLLAGSLVAVSGMASAEIMAPAVGTKLAFSCTGAYDDSHSMTLVKNDNGKLRFEGKDGDRSSWVEKDVSTLGLTVFMRRDRGDGEGVRAQSYDEDDFLAYAALKPGSSIEADVRERKSGSKWEWGYEISIGEPRTLDHPVAGTVEVVEVSEKRKVYGGKYSSSMTVDLVPAMGITTRWVYRDSEGSQTCELTEMSKG